MAGRFPLLLDEHVPRSLEQALRQHGWAAVRVVDLKEPTTRQVGRPLVNRAHGILRMRQVGVLQGEDMAAQILPIESVVSDPEIRNGSPLVAGTTLRVSDLAAYHTLAGLTPDQLSAQFDLDLAQVHAALSYYFRHKASVDAEIRANSEQAELWRQRLAAQRRSTTG